MITYDLYTEVDTVLNRQSSTVLNRQSDNSTMNKKPNTIHT